MKFCKHIITRGPSRRLPCGEPLIATCDRSKLSSLIEFRGQEWTKKKLQRMNMYPEAEEQEDLCFWHQRKYIEDKIGRES
jgi:hypothetical protein